MVCPAAVPINSFVVGELKECAIDIAKIDKKMLKLRKEIEKI